MPRIRLLIKAPGRFKKVRPARPQPFLRAERTLSTWARKNGENAAGGFFQQTLAGMDRVFPCINHRQNNPCGYSNSRKLHMGLAGQWHHYRNSTGNLIVSSLTYGVPIACEMFEEAIRWAFPSLSWFYSPSSFEPKPMLMGLQRSWACTLISLWKWFSRISYLFSDCPDLRSLSLIPFGSVLSWFFVSPHEWREITCKSDVPSWLQSQFSTSS